MDTTRALPSTTMLKGLLTAYVAVCALTVLGEIAAAATGVVIGSGSWIRTSVVLAVSVITVRIARAALRGSARSYLRLRILTAAQLVAVAVIVALPGAFPVWLRVEQTVCGLVLLGLVVVLNGARMRAAFRVPA